MPALHGTATRAQDRICRLALDESSEQMLAIGAGGASPSACRPMSRARRSFCSSADRGAVQDGRRDSDRSRRRAAGSPHRFVGRTCGTPGTSTASTHTIETTWTISPLSTYDRMHYSGSGSWRYFPRSRAASAACGGRGNVDRDDAVIHRASWKGWGGR